MRDKYIKIFEQELENSRAIMGDCEKAVINALEDVSARAGRQGYRVPVTGKLSQHHALACCCGSFLFCLT